MNNELERLKKREQSWPNQDIILHLPQGLRKTMKNLGQDSQVLPRIQTEPLPNSLPHHYC